MEKDEKAEEKEAENKKDREEGTKGLETVREEEENTDEKKSGKKSLHQPSSLQNDSEHGSLSARGSRRMSSVSSQGRFPPPQATPRPSLQEKVPVKPPPVRDTLRNEMMYYVSSLRVTIPTMTRDRDKLRLQRWFRYVMDPEKVGDKEQRNRYLLFITVSAINDECIGFLKTSPSDQLPPISSRESRIPQAQWEMDAYWDDMARDLSCDAGFICPVHGKGGCRPNEDSEGNLQPVAGHLMDQEFKYFLFLARPYAALLPDPGDRRRVALWLQSLSSVAPCSCAYMKGNRNDYIQALLGFLHDLRAPGPFSKFPPLGKTLPALAEAVSKETETDVTDPGCDEAEEFMTDQPVPESGAVCYIALSGEPDGCLNELNQFTE